MSAVRMDEGAMSHGLTNLDRQSLRGFLQLVERDFPDEILRIREPVRTDLDITSIVFELERAGKSPVVVYENVEGSSMPIVTNIAGNRKLLAACLGVCVADLPTAFRDRCQGFVPCEPVTSAPWKEVPVEGVEVDLTRWPFRLIFAFEPAPDFTSGRLPAASPFPG